LTTVLVDSTETQPDATPPQVDDADLHECVRDLVALSTMPATWIGKPPARIAENVRDLIVSMIHPDSVYVELQDRSFGQTHTATAHGRPVAEEEKAEALYRDVSSAPLIVDSEVALGLASFPIGTEGELGRLSVGSTRDRFPSRTEVLLLQVASNQIAVALRHTELIGRHEKAEQELDAARQAAERMSRVKSEFLAMMSHELRTPLNAIAGYLDILLNGIRGPLTEEQRIDLGRIKRSQQHLLRVIENVLGYLKLGSGRVSYDMGDVSIEDVVATVEEITRPLVDGKRLSYVRRVAERLHAHADHAKVEQILLNLVSNAIKFTPPGGDIELESNARESQVWIRVRDSGVGIPADRLENVFEPFVQVESARTRTNGGTGLGLSISREFARGMNGQLLVESELGKGSVFTLVLAAGAAEPPSTVPRTA
jgi:signal transduction histidine kinase